MKLSVENRLFGSLKLQSEQGSISVKMKTFLLLIVGSAIALSSTVEAQEIPDAKPFNIPKFISVRAEMRFQDKNPSSMFDQMLIFLFIFLSLFFQQEDQKMSIKQCLVESNITYEVVAILMTRQWVS